jgi:hypothetical protein
MSPGMDEKESLRQRIPNATVADFSFVHGEIGAMASISGVLLFVNSALTFLNPGRADPFPRRPLARVATPPSP